MKTCPFCTEEIRDEAIKCKHCGSMLNGSDPASSGAAREARRSSFSLAGLFGAFIALCGVVIGLVGAIVKPPVAIVGIVLLIIGAGIGAKYK